MDPKDFQNSAAGKDIRTQQGYAAFVPAVMPPKIDFDQKLVLSLSRADTALSELSGAGRLLPNPHLLIESYIRREAVLSSRIEGTRASLSDILLDEIKADVPHGDEADIREVRNYVTALEYGIQRLNKLPLSLRLIRELHSHLMKGVRGNQATPGDFRRSQNWIGSAGSTPATAAYVPPPPSEMMESLADLEKFMHSRDVFPDLIQCALIHEYFEAIHPFLDGNGRVGRLLITFFLLERGRLSQPLLYLSAYFEANRRNYYDTLQRIRTHGDWNGWLIYFLEGVTETARDAIQRANNLMDLREKFRLRLSTKPKALILMDELFSNPYITVAKVAELLKTSNPTARQIVVLLQKNGLLEEVSGREWGRLYLARPILDAVGKQLKNKSLVVH